MTNDFLPADEKQPETSNYMHLDSGENRFRVLSSAIIGNMYWKTIDGKRTPVRKRMDENIPFDDLEYDKWGNLERVKYFWAFVVWNYQAEKVQILELNQITVLKPIRTLVNNKKWGDPKQYDIVITKTGEAKETEYGVTPEPKEALNPAIATAFLALQIDLEQLYVNGDPFGSGVKSDASTDSTAEEINIDDVPWEK